MLVLNATFEPINVCTVRRATVLLLKDKAEVLDRFTPFGRTTTSIVQSSPFAPRGVTLAL